MLRLLPQGLCLLAWASSITAQHDDALGDLLGGTPQVQLDYGAFKGTTKYPGVDSFLGIPFAKAGRFENATIISATDKLSGVQDATKYGKACPQQEIVVSNVGSENAAAGAVLAAVEQLAFQPISNQGEDCLSINVQIPKGINSTAGLPVLFWIHGGGFQFGSSAALGSETTPIQGVIYQGAGLVQQSVALGQPIVFVSANHRLNGFGNLASQEVTDAGVSNLMLKDQRLAMQWIQNYIGAFGGDKSRVTLFGESAGSLSIATHLVLNDGDTEGLFHGAIMASGGIMKLKDYHHEQVTFDLLTERSGCGSAASKLDCLRTVDYEKLYKAVQTFPSFLGYSSAAQWYPRPDGTYLKASPHDLLRSGKVANIPYIIGDMKDEGTLFAVVPSFNTSNDKEFQQYWKTQFFQNLSDEQIQAYTSLYSQDQAQGSPFDTGDLNAITPQYKRLAASIGDYVFQMGRRDLLNYTAARQPAYTYQVEQSLYILGQLPILSGLVGLPIVGSFHGSDALLNEFRTIPPSISKNTRNIMSTFIAFVNSYDPNTHGLPDLPHWPEWSKSGRAMFNYNERGCTIIKDDYREKQMQFVNNNADLYTF